MAAASPSQLAVIGKIAAGLVKDGDRVGLGSGRAAIAAVRELGARVKSEGIKIIGVPTGTATEKVAREVGIPIECLDTVSELDIAIDGADEVDPAMNLLKGGGGNLTREKIVECIAKRLVIVVGEEKLVESMGAKFPVFLEALEFARPSVQRMLEAKGFKVVQRMQEDGSPFLTDDGNPILHASVPPGAWNPVAFDKMLHATPGVVESGIFVDMATEVYVAALDGKIKLLKKSADGQVTTSEVEPSTKD